MPRPLASELSTGVAGQAGPAEVLALRYELGCLFAAISLGLLQALILSLRIADGLGQHLAPPWSSAARAPISIGWRIGS